MPKDKDIEVYETSTGIEITSIIDGHDFDVSLYNDGDCFIKIGDYVNSIIIWTDKKKLRELVDTIRKYLSDEEESSEKTIS